MPGIRVRLPPGRDALPHATRQLRVRWAMRLPANEHASDRYWSRDRSVSTGLVIVERPACRVEVQIAPGGHVLVRVELRRVGKLDLAHPHEPAREIVPEHMNQGLPMRLLVLDELAGDAVASSHSDTVGMDAQRNKPKSLRGCIESAPSSCSSWSPGECPVRMAA